MKRKGIPPPWAVGRVNTVGNKFELNEPPSLHLLYIKETVLSLSLSLSLYRHTQLAMNNFFLFFFWFCVTPGRTVSHRRFRWRSSVEKWPFFFGWLKLFFLCSFFFLHLNFIHRSQRQVMSPSGRWLLNRRWRHLVMSSRVTLPSFP